MLRETLSAVATIRENDRALACLKAAVEAVLSANTLAMENWWVDFGGGKLSDLKAKPTRHELLLKAMGVAFPAPQAGTPQRRYWDRQAARMAEGSLPDGPREGEAVLNGAGIASQATQVQPDPYPGNTSNWQTDCGPPPIPSLRWVSRRDPGRLSEHILQQWVNGKWVSVGWDEV